MAKVVMLKVDGSLAMAVIPASRMISLNAVKTSLGAKEVRLATDDEFAPRFPECEIGAMPPFGNLFDLPVYVDPTLEEDETIFFNAGNHEQTVKMRYRDFARLVQPCVVRLVKKKKKKSSLIGRVGNLSPTYLIERVQKYPKKEVGTMAEKTKERESRAIAPRRPFMDLTTWEREMDRMMGDFFGRRMRPFWPERWFRGEEIGAPALDVYEEKEEIVVKAELPGIEKEDLNVNISDHLLTIKGEKKKEEETKEENYYRRERSYGAFVRSVELPADVQPDKVKASFKNGVLEVRLPKTEEAKAKEIKVKVD